MFLKLNRKSNWKRSAVAALAFLLLIFTPTLAFADYSINGYTVKGTGGGKIKIVDANGKVVYQGKGERNEYGRLAPPTSSGLNNKITAPDVRQSYAQSNSSQYNNYRGEVAVQKDGKVVGWGSLYTDESGGGNVFVNQEGISSREIANRTDNWIRDNARESGYYVQWNQYAGGLGTVDLNKRTSSPPSKPQRPRPQIRYFTETSSFAGPSVVYSRSSDYVGETTRMTGSSYHYEDGSPTYETRQYVRGDYLYTVTIKKWTRYKFQKQTWKVYKKYNTDIRSKTPWYHKYTRYLEVGRFKKVIRTWKDDSPYKWTYSSRTTTHLAPVQSYSRNVLINSWQEQTQSVKREWAKVAVRAELAPGQARRGDEVIVTAYTSGPATAAWAEFPSGRVQLRLVGGNQWKGTYLVDNPDGIYPIDVTAKGRANEEKATVSLVVSGDRYHVIPNITGGN
jgi:hypothetical protein